MGMEGPSWELIELQRRAIARLEEEVQTLRRQLAERDATIQQLRKRIEELERETMRPAAPFRRPDEKKVPAADKKRPGRKPGHPGAYRRPPPQIDEEIDVPLHACPHCQGAVLGCTPLTQIIEEIPPVRPRVFRLTTWSGWCKRCGEVRTSHPLQTSTAQGAAGTHLGPRALALGAMLNKHLGLTMRKTTRVLRQACGLSLTAGGLSQALDRVAQRVEGDYAQLLTTIRGSRAVFSDETSWWVGEPGWWLWTFTTPEATLYRIEPHRNTDVVFQVLGSDFAGMLVSDCLNIYDQPDFQKHKCIAHHLRAIAAARDRPDTGDTEYLKAWRLFFSKVLLHYASREKMQAEGYARGCAALQAERDQLLARPVTVPGEVAVRNRLEKQREHMLGCLEEPAAEPTNNRAERALRPIVIARKVSCGNKTQQGRTTLQILASLAETCRQRSQDFLDWLAPRLALMPAGG